MPVEAENFQAATVFLQGSARAVDSLDSRKRAWHWVDKSYYFYFGGLSAQASSFFRSADGSSDICSDPVSENFPT